METRTYSATLHIKETYVHPVYGRIFDGWVESEATGVFDNAHYAMTSSQAIAYKVAAEKRAWEWTNITKHFDADTMEPVNVVINLDYAPEFLQ